jgi:CRP-like cAMP-binding protein
VIGLVPEIRAEKPWGKPLRNKRNSQDSALVSLDLSSINTVSKPQQERFISQGAERYSEPSEHSSRISAKSVIALFREGQAICSQSDTSKEVFYIEKGQVKVTVKSKRRKETVLAVLHRGDYLGAGCMTGQTFRTVTATAITRCRILVIEKKR